MPDEQENAAPAAQPAAAQQTPATSSTNILRNGDVLQSLLSTPSYRQNARVVRPGPELEALMLARQRAAQ